MSIKASSVLAVIAIWAAMIPAVIAQPDAWWTLVFAMLATFAVGVSFWRRLGLPRVIAVAGTWTGAAMVTGYDAGAGWITIFAFLTTAALVYSSMRRDGWAHGLAIAAAWLAVGTVIVVNDDPGAAWIGIFAFLTAGSVANSRRNARAFAAILWWGIAAGVMLAGDGWYWLAPVAFILSAMTVGMTDFHWARRFEWDLFDSGDSADEPGPRAGSGGPGRGPHGAARVIIIEQKDDD
ncbi:MAG: hypothetical protein HYX53_14270 [Chloroflexi bacterium]|nr:hypothetical protein [Chloroflexota bacterium]